MENDTSRPNWYQVEAKYSWTAESQYLCMFVIMVDWLGVENHKPIVLIAEKFSTAVCCLHWLVGIQYALHVWLIAWDVLIKRVRQSAM